MGLLSKATAIDWLETKAHSEDIRRDGITQLINQYAKYSNKQIEERSWGYEIEYILLEVNDESVRVSPRANEILDQLHSIGMKNWHQEYADYMLEAIPKFPFKFILSDFIGLCNDIQLVNSDAEKFLKANEKLAKLSNFWRLGLVDSFPPNVNYNNDVTKSLYFPDEIISPHTRFPTLTRNIRERRGSKVSIQVPLYQDINTPNSTLRLEEALFPSLDHPRIQDNHHYMDAMGFGMGCCCIQTTIQTKNLDEARWLYDQLIPIAPIIMALSASTPIFRGYLCNVDCRWQVISDSTDDRTPMEIAAKIIKPRFTSVSRFISNDPSHLTEYNDISIAFNESAYYRLRESGVDEKLAIHFAHLFIRDPIAVYRELLLQDNDNSMDHFENIQSTNWQTVRIKVPPIQGNAFNAAIPAATATATAATTTTCTSIASSIKGTENASIIIKDRNGNSINDNQDNIGNDENITLNRNDSDNDRHIPNVNVNTGADANAGWRVEFRCTEIQPSDHMNSAFIVYILLLSLCIMEERLCFYMPISMVDENIAKAQERDSISHCKFSFRTNIHDKNSAAIIESLSIDEIINGKVISDDGSSQSSDPNSTPSSISFKGLNHVIKEKLKEKGYQCKDDNNNNKKNNIKTDFIDYMLDLMSNRARGKLSTIAKWQRDYVINHQDYKSDSYVSQKICHDMCLEFLKKFNNSNSNN